MEHDQHRLLANGVVISLMLPYTDSQSCNLFVLIFIKTFTHFLLHTHVQHAAMVYINIRWAIGDRRSAEPARRASLEGASHQAYCYACSMLMAMLAAPADGNLRMHTTECGYM